MWYEIFICYLGRQKVDVLKDMLLLFRDHPNQCLEPFDTDEIATAIKCICTE